VKVLVAKLKAKIEQRIVRVPLSGCWLWTGALSDTGYGSLRTSEGLFNAHRASYLAHVGPIPDGLWVLHSCDIRSCCNPYHLFLGTRRDNIADASAKGRLSGSRSRPKGLKYKRPLAHLDEAILAAARAGETASAISRMLKINRRTVARSLSRYATP